MSGRDLVRGMRTGGQSSREAPPHGGHGGLLVFAATLMMVGLLSFFATVWLTQHPFSQPPLAASVSVGLTLEAVAWTEADTSRCEAFAQERGRSSIPMEMALAVPSVTDGFGVMASYLECQLTTKVIRLCTSDAKEELIERVNDYLTRTDLITAGLHFQGAPMALLGEIFGGEISAGSDIYDIETADTFAYMKMYNDRVAEALRQLARAGLIEASDFGGFMGWGVPGTITEIIGSVKPEHSSCA